MSEHHALALTLDSAALLNAAIDTTDRLREQPETTRYPLVTHEEPERDGISVARATRFDAVGNMAVRRCVWLQNCLMSGRLSASPWALFDGQRATVSGWTICTSFFHGVCHMRFRG